MVVSPGRADEIKKAESPAPIIPEVAERWSPRSFSEKPVSDEALRTLLEAARWAPSSYNEQPWRFIVARREDEDEYERLLSCLNENNREWARGAPVLMLTAASTTFDLDGRDNRHAFHDVGLAMGGLLAQATAMGLHVHQMAGIHPEKAKDVYDVPEDHEVVAGVAVGYLGAVEEDAAEPRSRKPLEEIVFRGQWGDPAPVADADVKSRKSQN